MNQWDTMLAALLAIFVIVGTGIFARRVGWLTEQADQSLFKLVVRVLLPALILDKVVGNPALSEARNLWLPPLVGFGTVILGMALARVVARGLGWSMRLSTARQQRTFALSTGVYNYGYVPLPLAVALFDEQTVGVLFVHNLGVEIAMWTVGIIVVSGGLDSGWWRRLFNPPAVAIAVALVINGLMELTRGWGVFADASATPGVLAALASVVSGAVGHVVAMLGACAIPMGVLLTGATVADFLREAKLISGGRVIAGSCALRLAILPALFLALAWVLVPASLELKRVMVLQAAMPAAIFPIVLARHYHGDVSTAVRVAVGTSLVGLVTMPLWLSAGLWLLGLNAPGQ